MSSNVHPIFESVIAAARGAAEGEQPAMHTPGPWKVDGRAGYSGHRIVDQRAKSVAAFPSTMRRDEAERDANARLISAAPDMLAALRDSVKWCRRCDGSGLAPNEDSPTEPYMDCPDCKTQRVAIARASGGEG